MTKKSIKIALNWSPQKGPQEALVACDHPEVFLGGARGGGKTDGVLGKWCLKEKAYGQHFNAVALRRTSVSFADAIERSREIYTPLGGKFNESKLTWRMPNGGRVAFGYLENIGDAMQFQGRNLTDVWVEEAGQYPTSDPIDRMFGTLRSTHGVPTQLILTGNPGGAGQHWLAARYKLIPFPRAPQFFDRHMRNGKSHRVAVIPARISDNQILMLNDPTYIDKLQLVGGPQLVKAWLEGDFSTVEGAFFEMWSEARHVLRAVPLPTDWMRYRSMDWGTASPSAVGWFAVCQDTWMHPDGMTIPRGALIMYREWYTSADPGTSDVGLKLSNPELGKGIVARERNDPKLSIGVLDPSCFAEDGGRPIAEQINDELLKAKLTPFHKADNKRILSQGDKRGAISGWGELRNRLIGVDGVPLIYFFHTCIATIRTLPQLQHDPMRAEDLDTNSCDHCADMVRYAVMARPWVKSALIEDPEDRLLREPDSRSYSESDRVPMDQWMQSSIKMM
jgi:hypothetical protein